jgi:hypothetical protein
MGQCSDEFRNSFLLHRRWGRVMRKGFTTLSFATVE